MHRLSGQDASFLYSETPTVLMHTIKIQILESKFDVVDYREMRERLEAALDLVPVLRQRVMFVPFNLHHPVLVDDPDFDLDAHIYRAGLPAPGGQRELDEMIAQIICHRLDRDRPLWELWVLTGLEDGRVAVVHKIHHCLADGAATVRYLSRVFEQQAAYEARPRPPWSPAPLPSARKLIGDALVDQLKHDVRKLPTALSSIWSSARRLLAFSRDVGSPTLESFLKHRPPRTRLNHALSPRRTFTTRQIALADVKQVGARLDGTVNDVILALSAAAIRRYLIKYDDLPDEPLYTSVPVSADDPGARRESGNRTTYFPSCLWTNIEDPLERFHAIQNSTRLGKQELQVLGKDALITLLQYLPPALSLSKAARMHRRRVADRRGYRPGTNVIISNVPGPRERLSGNYGTLLDLYSMGPLVEGCGLNITVWSYAGNLNFSLMGCKKAVPDIDILADGLLAGMDELQQTVGAVEDPHEAKV